MPFILKKMWINIEIHITIATAAAPFNKCFITFYFLSKINLFTAKYYTRENSNFFKTVIKCPDS